MVRPKIIKRAMGTIGDYIDGLNVATIEQTEEYLKSKSDKKIKALYVKSKKKRKAFILNAAGGVKHYVTPGMVRAEVERRNNLGD